jgi:hypothetical protein
MVPIAISIGAAPRRSSDAWARGGCNDGIRDLDDLDPIRAEIQRVTLVERRVLVDRGAIEHRARRAAEVDDPDIVAGHFDDRVHAGDGVVIETQVAALELANLDDVLGKRLGVDELVGAENLERERLAGHRILVCARSGLRALALRRQPHGA